MLLYLALLLLTLVHSLRGECVEESVYKQYADCEKQIKEQYQSVSTCAIITHIIDDCPEILKSCKSDVEIKDIHADLIKENIAHKISLDDCEIVGKYRAEGFLGTSIPPNCTKEMDTKLRSDFQNCSTKLADAVVPSVPDKTNFTKVEVLVQVTCDTLLKLSTQCKGILDECITEEDKTALFNEQLKSLTSHLQTVLNTTESLPSLSSCNATEPDSIADVASNIASIYSSTKKIVKALSENENSNREHILFGSGSPGSLTGHLSMSTLLFVVVFFSFTVNSFFSV